MTEMENAGKTVDDDILEEYEELIPEVTEAMVLNGSFAESYAYPADTPEGKEERDTLHNNELARLMAKGISEQDAKFIIAQAPFHMMKVHNIMVRAENAEITSRNAARHERNKVREIRAYAKRNSEEKP